MITIINDNGKSEIIQTERNIEREPENSQAYYDAINRDKENAEILNEVWGRR